MRYLRSCIWLTFPALLFNLAFMAWLPAAFSSEVFWHDIPGAISIPENVLRFVVFAAPALMPLRVDTPSQRQGLGLFVAGTLIYFLSWGALIAWPESAWSTSAFGFMAPAYTPLLWLVGIARMGDTLFFDLRYRWWMYALLSIVFLFFHNAHAWLVFSRLGIGG